MSILKGLNPGARVLVTEDFRKGDPVTVDATDYIVELELGRKIDLLSLRAMVETSMQRFEHEPWKSDPWLGPRLHATLRLTRREAADKRIWQYLTVVEFQEYVRWRWSQENADDPVTLDRFFGEDSKNALSRLWWTAEMTRNGSDYGPAVHALSIPRFSNHWHPLNLMHHKPAALAAVDFLRLFQTKGTTTAQAEQMAKSVNVALRTLCLDALTANPATDGQAVRDWIKERIDETTMMDELPKGPDEAPVPEADIAAVRKFLDDLAVRINLAEAKAKKRGRPPKAKTVES